MVARFLIPGNITWYSSDQKGREIDFASERLHCDFGVGILLAMRYPHRENCKCGGKEILSKGDLWWINAPEYDNCFWTYLRYNDRAHTLSEIAKMMRLSISAITSIERKAFAKIRKRSELLEPIEK